MRTLGRKLLVGTIIVQLIVLAILVLAGYRVIHQTLAAEARRSAVTTEELLGAALAPLMAAKDFAALRELITDTVDATSLAYIAVTDLADRPVAQAGIVPAEGSTRRFSPRDPAATAAEGVFHFISPINLAGQDYGRVAFGRSSAPHVAAEQELIVQLALIGAVGLAASLLLQSLLTNVLTTGLTRMSRAVDQVGAGQLDIRLPVDGRDEVAALSTALNRMSSALAERVRALEDSEARQRSLVEAMAEGVVVQDAQDRILVCNEAAPRILGLTRNQMLGLDPMDPQWRAVTRAGEPFAPDQHPSVRTLRTGKPQRDVLMGVHKSDGALTWVSINAEPLIRTGETRPYASVTTFANITPLVEAEERLLRLNSELEERVTQRTSDLAQALDMAETASRAKSEFLSRMSHELRTPLNAILGFAQILRIRGQALEHGERDQQVQQIETAGWHLLDLINEVLDLSRIESGAMIISREPVGLQPLVAECVQMVLPLARSMDVLVIDRTVEADGVQALADRTRLKQVITNLLSNGIKYNRSGGTVTLSVDETDAGWIGLSVADTGRGFSTTQLENLYQPFNRLGADQSTVEGAGIGLVITKRLTELMGGSLQLQTRESQGSTFTLRLPRATSADNDLPASATRSGPQIDHGPRLVLYIEDNPSNVELMRGVLSLRPHLHLIAAGDGHVGLALAHERLPDLIVIDVALPGIDGFEVCRRLRANAALAARPIVALSANAMRTDIERGREAGFDVYLTKPIEVPLFLAEIDRLFEGSPA